MLIANAGTADIKGWQNIDLASWNATLAVNLTAPFLLAQQVLPGMIERKFGRILFISRSRPSPAAWSAPTTRRARRACTASCITLRRASRPTASRSTAWHPRWSATHKMFPADLETATPPIPIPVGRVGRPDEIADMAIAMLRNGYLTNKVITLDGGIVPRTSSAAGPPCR